MFRSLPPRGREIVSAALPPAVPGALPARRPTCRGRARDTAVDRAPTRPPRYVRRTDIDFLMALGFDRAGQKDSAAVYAAYVRRAWTGADPESRRRLAALPR